MAFSTRSPDPVTLTPDTCRAHPRRQHLSHPGRWSAVLVPALAALSLLLAACSQSAPATSAAQTTAGRHPSATAVAGTGTGAGTSSGSPVKVYFSKHPDSDRNSTAVFAVTRVASNPQVATYAIQQLLAGPSASETRAGYFTPLTRALSGPSTCGGPDFQLTLNRMGGTPQPGTATLRFCRRVLEAEGNGAIPTEITTTLTQFATIHKVVLLTSTGNCYGDGSGMNLCLGHALVRVYFSKHPESDSTPTAVFAVTRVAPNPQVATYAIQQLIVGPTAAESAAGLYTTLGGWLPGASNCGGSDFLLTLNRKGATPAQGTATLRFCRWVLLGGDLSGARISAEIEATLLQFATIHQVVILTPQGGCFDDFSGLNRCLR
jgi:spore germination protein GerM